MILWQECAKQGTSGTVPSQIFLQLQPQNYYVYLTLTGKNETCSLLNAWAKFKIPAEIQGLYIFSVI